MHGPFKIVLPIKVESDPSPLDVIPRLVAPAGLYDAECNDHGAVRAILRDGQRLGIRPGEFAYVTLPPKGVSLIHEAIVAGLARLRPGVGHVRFCDGADCKIFAGSWAGQENPSHFYVGFELPPSHALEIPSGRLVPVGKRDE